MLERDEGQRGGGRMEAINRDGMTAQHLRSVPRREGGAEEGKGGSNHSWAVLCAF